MKNIFLRTKDIDTSHNNISVLEKDIVLNGIHIQANSLILVDDVYIYVNEMPTHFYHILMKLYKENLTDNISDNKIVIEHPEHCDQHKYLLNGKVEIQTGSTAWWNKDHFCLASPPESTLLNSLPSFEYKGLQISSYGFQISILSNELYGYIYKKDGQWYEKVNLGDDLKVR